MHLLGSRAQNNTHQTPKSTNFKILLQSLLHTCTEEETLISFSTHKFFQACILVFQSCEFHIFNHILLWETVSF